LGKKTWARTHRGPKESGPWGIMNEGKKGVVREVLWRYEMKKQENDRTVSSCTIREPGAGGRRTGEKQSPLLGGAIVHQRVGNTENRKNHHCLRKGGGTGKEKKKRFCIIRSKKTNQKRRGRRDNTYKETVPTSPPRGHRREI